jgi:hypothetical protein
MRISKGPVTLTKFLLITVICVSIGVLSTIVGLKNNAGAEPEEDSGIHDYQGLDVIVINNDIYEKDRKGLCYFEHRKHAFEYDISCWKCHHDFDDGENIWSPWEGETLLCSDCHDPEDEDGNIVKLHTAYHLNCKGCHEEREIFGDDPLAYRKCTTCHEKTE